MISQGGGTQQFVILQGGGTCGWCGISKNRLCPIILGHICRWKILKMRAILWFHRVEEQT